MSLPAFCIRRPVFTVVISLALIVLGVLGYSQIDLAPEPNVFRPGIHLIVNVPGGSASYIEENVIIPLENQLQNVPYLSLMVSNSTQGTAQINLQFKNISPENFLTAQSQVLNAVNSTDLPQDAQPPIIRQSSENNQLMFLAVSARNMDHLQLIDFVQNNIVKRLSQVSGVGAVEQESPTLALRVSLSTKDMALLGVTVQDVLDALNANDISVQAGQVMNDTQVIPVNLSNKPQNIQQFQRIIIKQQGQRIIRLEDVALVKIDNAYYPSSYTYYNEGPGVGISIDTANGINPIALGKKMRVVLDAIQFALPPGMTIHTLWDVSVLLQHAVQEVFWTILESIVLVSFVIFLFLGRLRLAFIPLVTIPICIVSAFSVMWLLGYTMNMLTLLALVLAVGLVVDDAIVVLENSHRFMEKGLSPVEATLNSMKQIIFPVIGMTIAVIAVYIPVAFITGKAAIFFQQFAFTLAGAVLISGIVALTLTPMMCARGLTATTPRRYAKTVEAGFERLRTLYQMGLEKILLRRWIIVSLFIILFVGGYALFRALPSTLLPEEYAGYLFLMIEAPDSASALYTEKIAKEVIAQVTPLPEVADLLTFGGGTAAANTAMEVIRLKPAYMSAAQTIAFAGRMNRLFQNRRDAVVVASPMNISFDSNNDQQNNNPNAISFYITGFATYDQLTTLSQALVDRLRASPIFSDAENNLRYSSQQYALTLLHDRASELNIAMPTLTQVISTLFGGYSMSMGYEFNGVAYPVVVQLPVSDLKDLTVLNRIFLNNGNGVFIPLSRLLKVTPTIDLPQRMHVNATRSGAISVIVNPHYTMGQGLAAVQAAAKAALPAGFSLVYPDRVQQLVQGNQRMALMFCLGLLFIYLVLAALFESFIDPLVILLTVPLCVMGALGLLKLTGGSLNIYSDIGLVTLIGLVSKHGILIVRFANELRSEGKSIHEAIVTAASIRLRPILMTTATMVLGALPLLFSTGVGSNAHQQLGVVIIAGLLVGTLFSLLVVPVAYTVLERFQTE